MGAEHIHCCRTRLLHTPMDHLSKFSIKRNMWYNIIWEVRPQKAQIRKAEAAHKTPHKKTKHQHPKNVKEAKQNRIKNVPQSFADYRISEVETSPRNHMSDFQDLVRCSAERDKESSLLLSVNNASSVHDAT